MLCLAGVSAACSTSQRMRDPEIFAEFSDPARLNTYYRDGSDLPGALATAERQSELFIDVASSEIVRSRGVGAALIGLVGAATGLAIVNTGSTELFTVLGLSGAALRIGNELTFDEDRRALLERYAQVTQCHLETHRPYLVTRAEHKKYTAYRDELLRAVDEVRMKSASLLATRDPSAETKSLLEDAVLKVDEADRSFGKLDLFLARTDSAGEDLRDRLRETLIEASAEVNKQDVISPDQAVAAAGQFASLESSILNFDVSDLAKRIGELSGAAAPAADGVVQQTADQQRVSPTAAQAAALILMREDLREAIAALEIARRNVARTIAIIDDDLKRARQKSDCDELAATDFTVTPSDPKITLKTGQSTTIVVSGVSATPKAVIGVQTVADALTLEPQPERNNAHPFKLSFKATVKQKATSRVTFTDEASGQSVTKEIILDYKPPSTPSTPAPNALDNQQATANTVFVKSVQQYLIRTLDPSPQLIANGDIKNDTRDALKRYQKRKGGLDNELGALGIETARKLSLDIIRSAHLGEAIFDGDAETTDAETICKAERALLEESKRNNRNINFIVIDGKLAENERGLVYQFQLDREQKAPGSFQYLTAKLDGLTLQYLNTASVKEGCPSS